MKNSLFCFRLKSLLKLEKWLTRWNQLVGRKLQSSSQLVSDNIPCLWCLGRCDLRYISWFLDMSDISSRVTRPVVLLVRLRERSLSPMQRFLKSKIWGNFQKISWNIYTDPCMKILISRKKYSISLLLKDGFPRCKCLLMKWEVNHWMIL